MMFFSYVVLFFVLEGIPIRKVLTSLFFTLMVLAREEETSPVVRLSLVLMAGGLVD